MNSEDLGNEQLKLAQERTFLADERTHLANERTFSAWIRTGLACIGGGIAIIRFLSFQHVLHEQIAFTSGVFLLVLGILIFFLSAFDYHKNYTKLTNKAGYVGSPFFITLVSIVLFIVSLLMIFITIN